MPPKMLSPTRSLIGRSVRTWVRVPLTDRFCFICPFRRESALAIFSLGGCDGRCAPSERELRGAQITSRMRMDPSISRDHRAKQHIGSLFRHRELNHLRTPVPKGAICSIARRPNDQDGKAQVATTSVTIVQVTLLLKKVVSRVGRSAMLEDGHIGRFGGVFYWQRFAFKKVSPLRMPFVALSAKCRPRTSLRKSSGTPSISSQAKSAVLKKLWHASEIAKRFVKSRINLPQVPCVSVCCSFVVFSF